jgi:ribose 5-phosphate isomerase B
MKIVLGCDHGGFGLKAKIVDHLKEKGYEVLDVGTYSTDSCNYPDYAHKVCEVIQRGECPLGILICGTGIGMSMAANKHTGIRAAVCENVFSARMTRMHNDANILCLGERVIGPGLACDLIDAFLGAEFLGDRHTARVNMLKELDGSL